MRLTSHGVIWRSGALRAGLWGSLGQLTWYLLHTLYSMLTQCFWRVCVVCIRVKCITWRTLQSKKQVPVRGQIERDNRQ